MPAAMVIPAPIAYIKVVADKMLVVGIRGRYKDRILEESSSWTIFSIDSRDHGQTLLV